MEVCWKRGQALGERQSCGQDVGRARAHLGAKLAAWGGTGNLPRLRLGSCTPGRAGSAAEGSAVKLTQRGFNRHRQPCVLVLQAPGGEDEDGEPGIVLRLDLAALGATGVPAGLV